MNINNKILFETKKLDCGCEYVLNDEEILKLDYCKDHIFEKYKLGDFSFLKSKNVNVMYEYFYKITEMNLWQYFIVNKPKKRRYTRRRFIQKEFRILFKYFKQKDKYYRKYIFKSYLKKMKHIFELGWTVYVKNTIDKYNR
jgi:hypothetical protein